MQPLAYTACCACAPTVGVEPINERGTTAGRLAHGVTRARSRGLLAIRTTMFGTALKTPLPLGTASNNCVPALLVLKALFFSVF
eukprot:5449297-Pyramimonas_sp.AAC.1